MWMPAKARRGHSIPGAVVTHGCELPLVDRWWELNSCTSRASGVICQTISPATFFCYFSFNVNYINKYK